MDQAAMRGATAAWGGVLMASTTLMVPLAPAAAQQVVAPYGASQVAAPPGAPPLVAPASPQPALVPRVAPSVSGDDPAYENGAIDALAGIVNGFRVEARVNTLYDGNIRRIGDGLVPAGTDRSDFRVTPSIDVGFARPLGRQRVFLNARFGRDFFLRRSEFSRNRYGADGGVQWQLGSRCSGNATISFNSAQQILFDVSQVDGNVQESFAVGGSGNCRVVGGLGVGLTVQRSQVRNDNIVRQQNDLNSIVYSPQITYGSPTLGRFSIGGTFNQIGYTRRTVIDTQGNVIDDGVNIYSARFGYQRGLGSRLSLNAGISYFSTNPDPRQIVVPISPISGIVLPRPSQSNLGYDVGLSYNSGRRISASLTGSRAATASPNVGAQSVVSQRVAADVNYRLNRAIDTSIGINYDQRDYRGSLQSPNEPLRRIADSFYRVYGSVNYAPSSLYSVGIEVAHQDRSSNPVDFSFASTSAVLRLRVGFGRRS